jgi:hypothetical protein
MHVKIAIQDRKKLGGHYSHHNAEGSFRFHSGYSCIDIKITSTVNIWIYSMQCIPKDRRKSLRIRAKIDSPFPFLCRKRRLNGVVHPIRPEKTESLCHSRCGTIKIPLCSKALSAKHRLNF